MGVVIGKMDGQVEKIFLGNNLTRSTKNYAKILKDKDLSEEEKISLQQIELMKTEVSYMCRYDNANGGVQYELTKDKKNTMHDDRAYVLALGAYALALLRRTDLIELKDKNTDYSSAPRCISSFSY